MKTKKVLLGSLVLAGVISSCTDEQIVDSVQGNAALSERTQVNLTLKAPSVESRMSAGEDGWSSLFETHDVLGAVLVDGGFAKEGESVWNNVNWTVVDGHVGNNKWAWNPEATEEGGAFVTDGTTAIGSWLFYTKYNEKMTTTRNGVEFDFPQIQEGSDDQEWLLNNNANFMISPVIHLAGYEGQKIDFYIEVPSVFTYLRMPFNLSATGAESVSKIIVKAKSDENTNVKFPTQYRVVNENIEKAKMVTTEGAPEEIALPRYEDLTEARELEKEMARAYDAMIYSHIDTDAEWNDPDFKNTVEDRSNGETTVDYLVVDFEGEHADKAGKGGLAVVDGKFSAMMLMPAGEYHSITFDIYTDKGVYTVTVDERDEFYNNLTAAQKANYTDVTVKGLFLRPGRRVMLSDIANKFGNNVHEEIVAEEYIKVTKKLEEENVTFIITKTADLINYIDGIKEKGTHNLTIITQDQIGDSSNGVDDEEFEAHTAALINKAVMDALVAKEAKVGDIQLVLNSNNPVKVVGEATAAAPLYIHDITFNNSCVVVSGNVTVGDAENNRNTELIIPEDQKMLVKGGVNLVLNNRCQEYDNFEKVEIESGAAVTIKNHLWIKEVVNAGTLVAETELESDNVSNTGTIEAKKLFNVDGSLTNWGIITSGSEMNVGGALINKKYAAITNNGVITLNGEDVNSSNNGTINNNSEFSVAGNLTNGGQINNAEDASIIVNTGAELDNAAGAVINNEGSMRCANDTYSNKINNLGTINAKKGSRTYITTNSSADEESGTNELVMGTVVLEEKNADMSVTVGTQQGYIQYAVPATTAELAYEQGDKFNKVILSGNTKFDESENNRVKYIVVDSKMELTLPATATIQEIEFNADAVLYAWPDGEISAKLALVKVGKNVEVTVPTENEINVEEVKNELTAGQKTFKSKTLADIQNEGEIIVGGDLYSTLPESITLNNGKFSSGDGENTAYHWGTSATTESDGYLMIGSTAKVFSSEGLKKAINSNVKSIVLAKGNYTVPETTGNMTISGGEDAIVTIKTSRAENIAFKGVTVVGSGVYTGVQHSNNVIYENCVVKGTQCLYANNVEFRNCTVDLTEKADYIWTYGAQNVTFDECIFNTLGKAILIYNEGKALVTSVTVKNCTFNAEANEEKAAIEIDSSLSIDGHYTLTTENNTVDSNFSGEWRIKKSGADNTTVNGVVYNAVTIDGSVVE